MSALPIDGDSFWGATDYLHAQLGERLGFDLLKYETEAEAKAAHPELENTEGIEGVSLLESGQAILVKEHLQSHGEAYQKYLHEMVGHLTAQLNPEQGNLLERVRDALGDERIAELIPEAYGQLGDEQVRAEELIARVVESLDVGKLDQAREGGSLKSRISGWIDEALGTKPTAQMNADVVLDVAREMVRFAQNAEQKDGTLKEGERFSLASD